MSTQTTEQKKNITDSTKAYSELNKIKIPLAELRMIIVDLMKDGFTEIPLGTLLYYIKHTKDMAQ